MKKIMVFLPAVLFSITLFAYPITPRPLRKLVMESQYIVWGKVLSTGTEKETGKKPADFWEREFAVVQVQEKLQGKLLSDTIKVYFTSGMICPAPGVLYDDEAALIFLDKKEKGNGFGIHALSYGVKHGLNTKEYQLYKDRIVEMQAMIAKDKEMNCSPEFVEWLIKCAAESCTRWEGLYELSPYSDFMSHYDNGKLSCKDTYLTADKRKKLFYVLLSIDTLAYSDMALVDLTTGINDSLLLEFLKSSLLKADTSYYWHAYEIIKRIVILTGSVELEELEKQLHEVYFGYEEKQKAAARDIFQKFLLKMPGIPLKKSIAVTGSNHVFLPAILHSRYDS